MFDFISQWKNKITQNIELRLELLKLDFIQRTSSILSYFIFTFICLLFTLCILFFLGIGIGEYFSSLTDSRTLGYFITAGIYIVLFAVLLLRSKRIIRLFINKFIGVMTQDDDDVTNSSNP